ncbi:MAG: Uma2 family endonuclease, partial [Lachnospiraceae bacterium]|nr:Uma2 family endonuclease [Lachnospiraceae bacterium]
IYNYARSLDSFSEVYFRLGAFLKNDNKNYVEPDIIVICDKNKLSERGYEGAPDLIIEIISPGSQGMDYGKKLYLYHDTGVCEYWIVDYEENHVIVHNFELNTVKMYTLSDKIPVGIYNGDLQIDFSTLNI